MNLTRIARTTSAAVVAEVSAMADTDRTANWKESTDMWNTCKTCNGRIERVEEDPKSPYWRHVDARDLDRPHAAKPAR